MANTILKGRPNAGNPHIRFGEGDVVPENPGRGSLRRIGERFRKVIPAAIVAAGLLVSGFSASAATITFEGDVSRDLSTAANWPNDTLPTAEDDIVIAVADGGTIENSAALAVKGVTIQNAGAYTMSGEGTFTIGANGMANAAASSGKAVTIAMPLATAGAQTWSFNGAALTLSGTITAAGTEDLTLQNVGTTKVTVPANFGGRLKFIGLSGAVRTLTYSGTPLSRWADRLYLKNMQLTVATTTSYTFSHLLPNGYENDTWIPLYLMNYNASGTVTLDSASKINANGDFIYARAQNTIVQDGGSIAAVSWVSVLPDGTYRLLSGTLDRQTDLYGGAFFDQQGGTVSSSQVHLGSSRTTSQVAEYCLSGGLFNPANFYLSSHFDSSDGSSAEYFHQTGGTATLNAIRLCGYSFRWSGLASPQKESYARLDLAGGTLSLGKDRIYTGVWNGTVDNSYKTIFDESGHSVYDLRLCGGTLNDSVNTAWGNTYQLSVCDAAHPSTLDWGTNAFTQIAPLGGDGTLRKVGTGTLTLADATRFVGTLEVTEGTVCLAGKTADIHTNDCVIFTADTAAEGLEAGALVSFWKDETKTLTAVPPYLDGGPYTDWTNVTLRPTVTTTSFNGHKGLKFTRSGNEITGLVLPNNQNPLVGATNFTVVCVIRDGGGGGSSTGGDYNYCYAEGLLGNTYEYGKSGFGFSVYSDRKASCGRSFERGMASASGNLFARANTAASVCDSKPHVLACSMDANRIIFSCDGVTTNRCFADLDFKAGTYPLYKYASNGATWKVAPLIFGFHSEMAMRKMAGSGGPGYAFDGEFAEIRIYRDRALTAAELNGVARALAEKYIGATATRAALTPSEATEAVFPAETAPALPSGALVFDAATVMAEDGAELTAWTSTDGTVTATPATADVTKGPTFVKNVAWGQPVVRFSAADKTGLGISTGDSPVAGKTNFAIAVVFRTEASCIKTTGAWKYGMGLVSIVTNGMYNIVGEEMAISLQGRGQLMLGLYNHDQNYKNPDYDYSAKPFDLNDGRVHVAILNVDATNGKTWRSVDGVRHAKTLTDTGKLPRDAVPLKFGLINAKLPNGGTDYEAKNRYYTGDLAVVAFWDRALTEAELVQITEHYSARFCRPVLPRFPFAVTNVVNRGLAATNIRVSAGATFRTPTTKTLPFTLKAGQNLSGAGRFDGSYRWADGASVGLAELAALDIEDAQIADGATLVVTEVPATPAALAGVSSYAGTITLDVTAIADRFTEYRTGLFAVTDAQLSEGAAFVLKGAPARCSAVVRRGVLSVVNEKKRPAFTIIFR